MKRNYFLITSMVFFLSVVGIACQPSSSTPQPVPVDDPIAQTSPGTIKNIQVKMVNPIKNEGEIEPFPLPNCGGTGELAQSLGTQASVSKSVTIGGRAKAKAGGEVAIPQTAKLQLELEIEAAYQQTYETANSRLDTIQMKAAAGSHVIYEVQWERQEFSSVATYEMDGEVFEAPYTYILKVPKINDSSQESCPTIGKVTPPTPIPPVEQKSNTSNNSDTEPENITREEESIRQHYQVVVGDGIFEQGTFSDGLASYSEEWLWDNDHRNIQNIRQEEYPNGCDVSRYNTNLIWISGSPGMSLTINGKEVGTYTIAPDPHGYIFQWPIEIGDTICAVGFSPSGFQIVLGPDIYYHYDSYCYRGAC